MDNGLFDEQINNMVGKSIGAADPLKIDGLSGSVLNSTLTNKYIHEATIHRTILNDARQIIMPTPKMEFDYIGFEEGLLEPGVEFEEPGSRAPHFKRKSLEVQEFITRIGITDQALRRDIERKNLVNTLVERASNQVGLDWEALAVCGSKEKFNPGSDKTNMQRLLSSSDGWVSQSTNKIYAHDKDGVIDDNSWDPNEPDTITGKMKLMLNAFIDKNVDVNREKMVYYLNTKDYNDYIEFGPGSRPTKTGDSALWGNVAQKFRSIEVREAPILNNRTCTDPNYGWGNFSILTIPDNLVYGVLHKMTIEPERHAALRSTDFIWTMEIGQTLEQTDMCVVAFDDLKKPSTGETRSKKTTKKSSKK